MCDTGNLNWLDTKWQKPCQFKGCCEWPKNPFPIEIFHSPLHCLCWLWCVQMQNNLWSSMALVCTNFPFYSSLCWKQQHQSCHFYIMIMLLKMLKNESINTFRPVGKPYLCFTCIFFHFFFSPSHHHSEDPCNWGAFCPSYIGPRWLIARFAHPSVWLLDLHIKKTDCWIYKPK